MKESLSAQKQELLHSLVEFLHSLSSSTRFSYDYL